jgi:hypothetical protein
MKANIAIKTLNRLAPPPSPFTLQGLFLQQQQLAFRPELNSWYVFCGGAAVGR